MFRKTLVIGFVALLLMSLATVAIAIEWDGVPDDPTPSQAVWVDPKNTPCLSIGETFVVDILVNITSPTSPGGTGLFGWEYKLSWNTSVIDTDQASSTPHVLPGTGFLVADDWSVPGRHWYAWTLFMPPSFTGVTSLCTYNFTVVGSGGSVLDLFETEFTDDTATVIISDTAAIGTTVDGIYCTAPHQFPVACFTFSPSAPVVGETVSFDASGSFDPDGTIVGWDWDFGDNSTDSGMIVTHAYAMAWHYTVTLTVTDNDGLADTARVVVTVFDVPCTLNEYFYWVSYYPFDNDFDGYNDAVEVEMDVDTDYSGTLDVTVDAYLIDPYGATVDSDYPWWSITDAWYDYGYAYLYVPPGSPEGWYSVELTLYDECWNYEDYMYSENVFYYQAEPCSFDEYFYEVNYYPFDNDFDGYNDAIIVEMDVDTDYSGTLTVYVDAYLIDPYGATVDSDFASWSIIDYAVEWGYVYLYVPDCGQFGWYDVELVLGDQCWNFEDYRYDSFVAHLYPPGVKLDTTLDFWFQPNPTHPGDTVELLGTLTDVYGNPVYPAQAGVEYSTDGGATWHYIWTLNTDAAGEFSRTFTAPGVGEYLVRVSYGGSASYNPTSDMETLTVQKLWGTYHFQIAPFVDVVHLNVDGSVIYGICDGEGFYHNQPVLGYIQGGSFYLFIDFTKDDFGNPIYYELAMLVGSVSTLSGNTYRTTDGTSWDGPTPFTLVSVSSSSEPSATGQALASPSTIEPQAWLPTSHFQIAPFVDVVHLGVDRPVLHGQCDALSYHDQPVLGYVVGDFFIFAIDFTKDDFGDPIYHELAIIAGSVSTKTGNMYRTVDGKSWDGPTPLTLVPAPP